MEESLPVGVHLVGSVPLGSAEEVFRRDRRRARRPHAPDPGRRDGRALGLDRLAVPAVQRAAAVRDRPARRLLLPRAAAAAAAHRRGRGAAWRSRSSATPSRRSASYRTFAQLKRDGVDPAGAAASSSRCRRRSPRSARSSPSSTRPSSSRSTRRRCAARSSASSRRSRPTSSRSSGTPATSSRCSRARSPSGSSDVRAGIVERLLRLAAARARGRRARLPPLLRRRRARPLRRAGGRGQARRDRQRARGVAGAAAELDPHAGAARPRRRRLLRAARRPAAPGARPSCTSASCTRPTARTARAAGSPPRSATSPGSASRPSAAGAAAAPRRSTACWSCTGLTRAAARRRRATGAAVPLARRLRADPRRGLDEPRRRRGRHRLRPRRRARLVPQPRPRPSRSSSARCATATCCSTTPAAPASCSTACGCACSTAAVGVVIVDASAKFLRVALEKYQGDPLVALRLLRYLKDEKRLQTLDEVLDLEFDALACTQRDPPLPRPRETLGAWTRALRPGGSVFINSGNIRNPRAKPAEWILDETVWVINDLAEGLVRSDPAVRPLPRGARRRRAHEGARRPPQPRVPAAAPARVLRRRARARPASRCSTCARRRSRRRSSEWFEFLTAYHDAVLGWVGGTQRIDGAEPTPGAVRDRLHLIRHAMETLFGGRPSFNACWTYITARKPG